VVIKGKRKGDSMKYLLGLIVLLSLGCSSTSSITSGSAPSSPVTMKYSITGQVADNTANASTSRNIYLRIDSDANTINGYIVQYSVASGAYTQNVTVSNVTENTYYIYFWKDINVNSAFGQFDVYGVPQVINLNNHLNIGTFSMNILL
jgi:hypothetical protein